MQGFDPPHRALVRPRYMAAHGSECNVSLSLSLSLGLEFRARGFRVYSGYRAVVSEQRLLGIRASGLSS